MRTIIELEDSQASRLDAWARSQSLSRAEAVRRAVTQMLERSVPEAGTGFGLWTQGQPVPPERDGLALQQALREEWPA
jgi:predicted transcriptional regulator